MIRILLSRFEKENEEYIYKEIKENLDKTLKSYLFVPDQYTLLSDINIMTKLDLEVIMDIKIKSFTSFSREILSEYGGQKRKLITDSGKNMLIKNLLLENMENLTIYKNSLNSNGFIDELSKTIKEFKDLGVKASDLEKISSEASMDQRLSSKLKEISLIYDEYEKAMLGKYIDSSDRLTLLEEKIEEADKLVAIKFYFDKFNSFNEKEFNVIEALNKKGIDMTFSLVLDPKLKDADRTDILDDGELFDISFSTYQRLRKIAGSDLEIKTFNCHKENELTYLTRNIFSYNSIDNISDKNTKMISCFEANSTEEEIEFIVEKINYLVKEKGYRFKDINIITSNEMEYDSIIKSYFERDGIPYFLDRKRMLKSNKLAEFILNLLGIFLGDLRIEDTVSCLKFFYPIIDYSKIEIFENYIKARKIRGSMYFNEKYFSLNQEYISSLKDEKIQEKYDEILIVNEVRSILLNIISDYYLDKSRDLSIDDHIRLLFKIFENEQVKTSMSRMIEENLNNELIREENSQVWDMFISLLNELSNLEIKRTMKKKEFLNILLDGFKRLNIGLIPPSQDNVFVGSFSRTRANASKLVFLVGLNDSYLPSCYEEKSILSEEERGLIRDKGIDINLTSVKRNREEMLSFYSAILRANEHVYLTYSKKSSSNQVMDKSLYLKRIEDIYRFIRKHDRLYFTKDKKYSDILRKKEMYETFSEYYTGNISEESSAFKKSLINYWSRKDPIIEKVLRHVERNKARRKLSQVTSERISKKVKSISVSRVERYAACPYSYFVNYNLRPEIKETFDLQKNEIGSICHRALEDIVNDYKLDPKKYDELELDDFIKLSSKYLSKPINSLVEDSRKEDPKNKMAIKLANKQIGLGAYNLVNQIKRSSFKPRYQEFNFGENSKDIGLIIEADNRKIYLEGKIDRVDEFDDKGNVLRTVIDYKTGRTEFDLSLLFEGIQIQLPIYLKAVTNNSNAKACAFFYLPVKNKILDIEESDKEKVLEELLKELRLNGIVLSDSSVIQELDHSVSEGISLNIKFDSRKNDFLKNNNVLEEEKFNYLLDKAVEVTKANIEKILSGDISLFPYYYKDRSNCAICKYKSMCKFEFLRDKKYRSIKKLSLNDLKE